MMRYVGGVYSWSYRVIRVLLRMVVDQIRWNGSVLKERFESGTSENSDRFDQTWTFDRL